MTLLAKRYDDYVAQLGDPRADALRRFNDDHAGLIAASHGSSHNHQAWPGGYKDHLAEIFRLAETVYGAMSQLRPLPFTLESALICLYFHDVEKIWKYTVGLPVDFSKDVFYETTLPARYGFTLTPTELNALRYAHGEGADYRSDKRIMNELAAFVHCCDTLSARVWHSEGRGLG
jgi:hypothetical protein